MDSLLRLLKEKIQEDLQRLGTDEKTKEPKHLTFSTIVKKQKSFVGYHPILPNGLNTSTKGKFIKDDGEVALFYLDDENNPLTLSQVFADPDGATDLFGGITRNLAFRQLDEESIDQMVAHFSELDLSQWEFQYEKGNSHHSISNQG